MGNAENKILERAERICKSVCNTKLTPTLTKQVVAFMLLGMSVRVACGHLKISDRTYRNGVKWGREGKAEEYVNFYNAVKQAEAETAYDMVSTWTHNAKRD